MLKTKVWSLAVLALLFLGQTARTQTHPEKLEPSALAIDAVDLPEATALLSTGAGDGAVQVVVDGYGSFGSKAVGFDPSFDPPGPLGPAGTVWDSAIYFSPLGKFLSISTTSLGNPALPSIAFSQVSGTLAVSEFSLPNFDVVLIQTLISKKPAGSVLVQEYRIVNVSGSSQSFKIVRHLDGDLDFDGTISDRGGREDGGRTLFEFDSGDNPASPDTYVGISAEATHFAGYSIWLYPFYDDILANAGIPPSALNVVSGDGNGDGLTDNAYDITLSQQVDVTMATGTVLVYRTSTVFGRGPTDGFKYVALGDSYSAGEGAENYHTGTDVSGNQCHRSANSYSQVGDVLPEIVAQPENFFACSGAVVDNVTASGTGQQEQEPDNIPQLLHTEIDETTDLVTLTIGGNDLQFADIVSDCYLKDNCWGAEAAGNISWETWIPEALETVVGAPLLGLLQEIRDLPANPRTILLGYPRLFVDGGSDCAVLTDPVCAYALVCYGEWTAAEQDWMNGIADDLNTKLREVAEAAGVEFIDVNAEGLFPGHEICSQEEWFRAPVDDVTDNPEIFHPNDIGQVQGYRAALEAYLMAHPTAPGGLSPSERDRRSTEIASRADRATLLPSRGRLRVTTASPICGPGVAGLGQSVELVAAGFQPFSTIGFEVVTPEGVTSLGAATADGLGGVAANLTIPGTVAPYSLVVFKGRGTGEQSEPRMVAGPYALVPEAVLDTDADGVPDPCDNCRTIANASQGDFDSDGNGDACDSCPSDPSDDSDGDGLCSSQDSCPLDPTNDADQDGLCAPLDNCPAEINPDQADEDQDLVGDACDSCQGVADVECLFGDPYESGDFRKWSVKVSGPNGICYLDPTCHGGDQYSARDNGSGNCVSVVACSTLWKCPEGPTTGSCGGGSQICAFSPGCSEGVQDCAPGLCTSVATCEDHLDFVNDARCPASTTVILPVESDAGLRGGLFGNIKYGGQLGGPPEQTAFGTGNDDSYFQFPGNAPIRGALRFNLTSIPVGAAVSNATLTLSFQQGVGAQPAPLSMNFDPYVSSWSESTVTWNNRPAINSGYRVSGLFPLSGYNPLPINVTSLVQAWVGGSIPNYGLEVSIPEWESLTHRAKYFGQRESGGSFGGATLTVTFLAP